MNNITHMDVATQLKFLEEAKAKGIAEIHYADKRIIYRSLKEMEKIIEDLRAQLRQGKKGRMTYFQFSKGLR